MQLRRHEGIRLAVTAATAALLGAPAGARAEGAGRVESSLLLYSETHRVQAAEGVLDFSRQLDERRSLALRLTFDGLTGASPTGAAPASYAQTFTGPSGRSGYTIPAGQIPLDHAFKDTRIAGDGTLTSQLGRLTQASYGGHLSLERDYTSIGVHGGLRRDFNRRNTTLGLSLALGHDTVSPRGGAPEPFSVLTTSTGDADGEGGDDGFGGGRGPGRGKDVIDGVLGLTQVIDRRTVLSLDYSYGRTSGYLTDPYKVLSVVYEEGSSSPGDPFEYVHESRPSTRLRQAVYAGLKRHLLGATADLSYRRFWDDWGVRSRTFDLLTTVPLGGGHAIEPHVRWYRQTAADFFRYYLVHGQALPQYASADSRLNAFDALTVGLKYSLPVGDNDHVSLSAEYYRQHGSRGPPDAIGVLRQYDLFPRLDVVMLRVGYGHAF